MRRIVLCVLVCPFLGDALTGCGGSGGGSGVAANGGAAGKPSILPAFASLNLYSVGSPFNSALGVDPEVDPSSTTLVQSLVRAAAFVLQVRQYSAPVYFAPDTRQSGQHDVTLTCGPHWELGVSVMKGVPIPDWAEPGTDTDGDTPPTGCGEGSDQDNHMVVLDLANRCEYDFWQARKENGRWVASWANSISLESSGVYPAGISTRGSGFAFLGGVIWPDELKRGVITHALGFSYPYTKSGGPVAPATDSDGITDDPTAIPEGALLQLDPSFDLGGLSGYELTIAKALQMYGMYCVDTGGESGIGLYAVDSKSAASNPYAGVLPDADFVTLPDIPLDRFRVLKLGPQDADFQQKLQLIPSGCASFE